MANETLTAEQVNALLQKLSTDETFRTLFQNDIEAAFKQLPGSPKPPSDLPPGCCLKPQKLASMQQIADARDAIAKQLLSESTFKIFTLEA